MVELGGLLGQFDTLGHQLQPELASEENQTFEQRGHGPRSLDEGGEGTVDSK